MPLSIHAAYQHRLQTGDITPDAAQAQAVVALSRLEGELNALAEPSLGLGFFRRKASPLGVYLYGPVGRGKSMLMDLFFDSAPVRAKRRSHFHPFMAEVHADLDLWRRGSDADKRARFGQTKGDDPITGGDGFQMIRHRLGLAYTDGCLDLSFTWQRNYVSAGDAVAGNAYSITLSLRNIGTR
jgi:hypothetical protein